MATAKKTASAAETFETWTAATPEAFKEGYEKVAGGFTKWADFNRESFEAFSASAGRIAKGIEQAASEQSAFAKESYEDGVAAFKAATTSKSVQEALDIQSEFLRNAFEKNLTQFNKLADHWISTTKDAAEPLTTRYSEFVDMVQSYRP
jgi:phasin family protein